MRYPRASRRQWGRTRPVPGCRSDCRGFATLTQAEADEWVRPTCANDVQMYAHRNRDPAVNMMIAGRDTVHGAYEYFEEASKGTLEAGKRADLVCWSATR